MHLVLSAFELALFALTLIFTPGIFPPPSFLILRTSSAEDQLWAVACLYQRRHRRGLGFSRHVRPPSTRPSTTSLGSSMTKALAIRLQYSLTPLPAYEVSSYSPVDYEAFFDGGRTYFNWSGSSSHAQSRYFSVLYGLVFVYVVFTESRANEDKPLEGNESLSDIVELFFSEEADTEECVEPYDDISTEDSSLHLEPDVEVIALEEPLHERVEPCDCTSTESYSLPLEPSAEPIALEKSFHKCVEPRACSSETSLPPHEPGVEVITLEELLPSSTERPPRRRKTPQERCAARRRNRHNQAARKAAKRAEVEKDVVVPPLMVQTTVEDRRWDVLCPPWTFDTVQCEETTGNVSSKVTSGKGQGPKPQLSSHPPLVFEPIRGQPKWYGVISR
ncbi:hypothetical protein BDQ17DRAFT_1429892 [Cyathus striatus]|nr:hypothetical protein BDQ17DRAFT_1429892 [Cyathus striatus]